MLNNLLIVKLKCCVLVKSEWNFLMGRFHIALETKTVFLLFPFPLFSLTELFIKYCLHMNSDIESEPPPEPAPPEVLPPSHRDISMASINAITIKQPSNFVLKIDKNGDQIHEEFIPQNQHGKFFTPVISFFFCVGRFSDDAATRHEQ